MPRPCLPLALLAVLALTGCGSAPDPLRAWDVEPPYLPPRDPASLSAAEGAATPGAQPRRTPRARELRESQVAEGAPTDAQVSAALREAYGGAGGTDVDRATVDPNGRATVPATAPRRLVALMRGANEVAARPYVYGGGHGRNPEEIWQDSAYDCSGSISYALATAGYIDGPLDSTRLATFGRPGPGRWVTIYANASHAFMVVAGLRFDTSGRQKTGTRWQPSPRGLSGFTVRHPPGL